MTMTLPNGIRPADARDFQANSEPRLPWSGGPLGADTEFLREQITA